MYKFRPSHRYLFTVSIKPFYSRTVHDTQSCQHGVSYVKVYDTHLAQLFYNYVISHIYTSYALQVASLYLNLYIKGVNIHLKILVVIKTSHFQSIGFRRMAPYQKPLFEIVKELPGSAR